MDAREGAWAACAKRGRRTAKTRTLKKRRPFATQGKRVRHPAERRGGRGKLRPYNGGAMRRDRSRKTHSQSGLAEEGFAVVFGAAEEEEGEGEDGDCFEAGESPLVAEVIAEGVLDGVGW
jgi:hypothetical protein